jgi:uncharacterized protein YggT (Ycf19 family)
VVLPFVGAAAGWWLASWLFVWMQIVPPVSMAARFEQSLVIGLSSYLVWKIPASVLLVLHLLNSYIYFGRHPLWKYVAATSQKILQPLRKIPLRLGKVDFAPIVGIVIIFLTAESLAHGLARLYAKLP